jgi:hypothetical protein
VLGAFLLRHRRSLPTAALRPLARSAILFVGYNVIFGLTQKRIDMAAHLGGLLGGFLAGLPLVHLLTPDAQARTRRCAPAVLVVGLVALGGLWTRVPRIPDPGAELDAQLPLVRRQLPGASIQLPAGKDVTSRLDYQQGRVVVELASPPARVNLDWNTAEMLTADELHRALIGPLAQAAKMSVVERAEIPVGNVSGVHWRLRAMESRTGWLISTVWPCGRRRFSLAVVSPGEGSKLEARLRASFECKPDAERDGKARAIAVQFDLPSDFGLAKKNPLIFASLDGQAITVASLGHAVSVESEGAKALIRNLLTASAVAAGALDATFEPMTVEKTNGGGRKVWRGRGTRNGEAVRLWSALIECGADAYLAVHFAPATQSETAAAGLLVAARCSPAPTLPRPFDEIAREACARGDNRGCDP